MEMECSHLTVHRQAPMKGLLSPGSDGYPCGIDGLVTDAGLPSLILRVLGTAWQLSCKGSRTSLCLCTWADQEIPYRTRRPMRLWLPFILASNRTISTFFSGEKTVTAFDLIFCRSKSTCAGNNMLEVQSFPLIIVGMKLLK